MIVVLLFASLVNAAWMTAPVVGWETQLIRASGIGRFGVVTLGMVLGLCILPFVVVALLARLSDRFGTKRVGWNSNLQRFSPALIPLGLGMWLAHYSFHLFTSGNAFLVAATRFIHDWKGGAYAINPAPCGCYNASAISWLLPLELLMMDFGLCVSLYVVYRIARLDFPRRSWIGVATPWFAFLFVFFALCVWVLLQPMQMRGVSMLGM